MACSSGGTIKLGDCLNFQGSSADKAFPDLATFMNHLLPNLYLFAGIVIFFFIFLGGFIMIANAGNTNKQQDGKQIITGALIGFLLVVLSYFIIQIVEVVTGIPILHSNLQ